MTGFKLAHRLGYRAQHVMLFVTHAQDVFLIQPEQVELAAELQPPATLNADREVARLRVRKYPRLTDVRGRIYLMSANRTLPQGNPRGGLCQLVAFLQVKPFQSQSHDVRKATQKADFVSGDSLKRDLCVAVHHYWNSFPAFPLLRISSSTS